MNPTSQLFHLFCSDLSIVIQSIGHLPLHVLGGSPGRVHHHLDLLHDAPQLHPQLVVQRRLLHPRGLQLRRRLLLSRVRFKGFLEKITSFYYRNSIQSNEKKKEGKMDLLLGLPLHPVSSHLLLLGLGGLRGEEAAQVGVLRHTGTWWGRSTGEGSWWWRGS